VEVDLAVAGTMETNCNPDGENVDATTIEDTILAYDPCRMLALKATRYPEGFPFAKATGNSAKSCRFPPGTPLLELATLLPFAALHFRFMDGDT
jgi:hypothetical protein